MITRHLVEEFIEKKPSIVREVFSSIIGGTENAQQIAIAGSESCLKKYGVRNSLLSPVQEKQIDFIHQFSLEEIESIAESESEIEQRSISFILFIKPFKPFWLGLLSSTMGLSRDVLISWNENNRDAYSAVGEGIFWAGFYLLLKK
jgi:hypothetical protein